MQNSTNSDNSNGIDVTKLAITDPLNPNNPDITIGKDGKKIIARGSPTWKRNFDENGKFLKGHELARDQRNRAKKRRILGEELKYVTPRVIKEMMEKLLEEAINGNMKAIQLFFTYFNPKDSVQLEIENKETVKIDFAALRQLSSNGASIKQDANSSNNITQEENTQGTQITDVEFLKIGQTHDDTHNTTHTDE